MCRRSACNFRRDTKQLNVSHIDTGYENDAARYSTTHRVGKINQIPASRPVVESGYRRLRYRPDRAILIDRVLR